MILLNIKSYALISRCFFLPEMVGIAAVAKSPYHIEVGK